VILPKEDYHHNTLNYALWSVEDKAWAAGFLDGDGMISFFSRRRAPYPVEYFVKISAVNTNREPLDKLQLLFGGSITPLTTKAKTPQNSDSWTWSTTHRNAERVLSVLSGYFVAKQEQTSLALVARQLVGSRGKKRTPDILKQLAAIEKRFRELNRKGD
jgi:hypothetical protein